MSSIIVLASDTPHRRFFIKSLMSKFSNIKCVIFETESIKPSFSTGPFYEREERKFENDSFFVDFDDDLDKVQLAIDFGIKGISGIIKRYTGFIPK